MAETPAGTDEPMHDEAETSAAAESDGGLEELGIQALATTVIPKGPDNHEDKPLGPIIEGLTGYQNGLSRMGVAGLLRQLMEIPAEQPIPYSVLGPTDDPRIVYAIPAIRELEFEEGDGGMGPRQPKPQEETKHRRLFEKDEFNRIFHKDHSYRKCKHIHAVHECRLGRCALRRKDYLEGCFKHPLTFNAATKELVDYHQEDVTRMQKEKEASLAGRAAKKKRKKARMEESKTPAKITALAQESIKVPIPWTKGCNEQYKGIFTYLTVIRAGYDFCIVRINSNYRRLTRTQWHAAGFGDVQEEPGQLGILFGGRRHRFMKRDHRKFLKYHGAVYSDEGRVPIFMANDIEMKYYSKILQDDDEHRHLPWSALLTVGSQIQAEIVPAELYGVEGWKPGMGIPKRPAAWPQMDKPMNWAVKNFRFKPATDESNLAQPVPYKNLAYITNVVTFGKHFETRFANSKSQTARDYGARVVEEAKALKQMAQFDHRMLPPNEQEDYSFYQLGREPKANDIHHILVTAGVPPHSTCYLPSPEALDDVVEQAGNTRLWSHEDFTYSASPNDLNRDFASGSLTAVEHKIPGYMVRDRHGRRLIGGTVNVRLKDEPCIYTSTFFSGMPSDFQESPRVQPINCVMGIPALATLAWAKAPQSECPEKYRWPQLGGMKRKDEGVVMQRAILATELICAMRQEQKESALQFGHIDVRTRGTDTSLKIECLLPISQNTKQSVFRYATDEGKPARLRSWDEKTKSLQGLNLVVIKTYPAYRFKENIAANRPDTMRAIGGELQHCKYDPFNIDNIRYTAPQDRPTSFPPQTNFKWAKEHSIHGVEFEDFKLPRGEASSCWEYVGTVVQMTTVTPNQRASVIAKELFTKHRFFILQHGRSDVMRCALAALSPLTYAKSLDRNQRQFKVRTDQYKKLQEKQAARDRDREEIAKNARGIYKKQLERMAKDHGTGEYVADHVLIEQFTAEFHVSHAMPKSDLWEKADLDDPSNSETHPAPKNVLYLGVLSAMALMQNMPERFPDKDTVLNRKNYVTIRTALKENGYPHEPSDAQLEIAIRAITGGRGETRQPIIVALGPPGTGKTSACEFTIRALIAYNLYNYKDGCPPRQDCHKSYLQQPNKNIPRDEMSILLVAESNFAVDRACQGIVGNYYEGPLSEKYSYFAEKKDKDTRILRHYSFKNKVKSEGSVVKDATFDAIAMYHDGPKCNDTIKRLRKDIEDNTGKIDKLLELIGEKHKKEEQSAEEEKEVARLASINRASTLKLWDHVLDTCKIDVLACTGAMLCDIRLRHPKLAFHTVIVEEFSQVMTAHVLQAIELLDTRYKDPSIIFFGDNKQMPVTTSLRGRLKAMAELNCVDVMMNPKESIMNALGVPTNSWIDWDLPEPRPVVEPVKLDVQYRMNEVLSGYIAHNIYVNHRLDTQFTIAKHLQCPVEKVYRNDAERASAAVMDGVTRGLSPHSKIYDLCHFPWPALGKQIMNIDVNVGKEEEKVTSKTHEKMVELVTRMVEFYVFEERGILAKDITILTGYDALRQDIEREINDRLQRTYGDFMGMEFIQAEADKDNKVIKPSFWRQEMTKFSDIEVCNLTGYQGRENRMIFFVNPRMANEPKKRRVQAADLISNPLSDTKVENWPVIDFEKVKEMKQLVANLLGYMDDETKMVVAGSRATSAYLVIQNVTTTDFSECWNKFNQASIEGGFYITNPFQLFQDALGYSRNPSCWYRGSDVCMEEPGGRDLKPKPISMKLTDQVRPVTPLNQDIETRPRHETYGENFFREPHNMDWHMRKKENGDFEGVQLINNRKEHNHYVRSCWSIIPKEKKESFDRWKGKLTAYNWTDMATANIAAEDEFGEGESGELDEGLIAKRLLESERILQELEDDNKTREEATTRSLELQLAAAESPDAANQFELNPELQPTADDIELREEELKALDPMKRIAPVIKEEVEDEQEQEEEEEEEEDWDEGDEEDEQEEDKEPDVQILFQNPPNKISPVLQFHVQETLGAFCKLIGPYSHPLFDNYITVYFEHLDDFPTIKLPSNWRNWKNTTLWGECERDFEKNSAYINEIRKTAPDDTRRRDPKFQLLCFDIIKRRPSYLRLKTNGLEKCETKHQMPHISPYEYEPEGGYRLVQKDDKWDRLQHAQEQSDLELKIITETGDEQMEA